MPPSTTIWSCQTPTRGLAPECGAGRRPGLSTQPEQDADGGLGNRNTGPVCTLGFARPIDSIWSLCYTGHNAGATEAYGGRCMSTKTKSDLSEQEVDQIVVAQADDDLAWEDLVCVRRAKPAPLSIPGDLAVRAAFLARLHRTRSVEDWLAKVIRERIELEEAAFIGVKQDLAAKAG